MKDSRAPTLAAVAPPITTVYGAGGPEAVGRLVGGQCESTPLERTAATAAVPTSAATRRTSAVGWRGRQMVEGVAIAPECL